MNPLTKKKLSILVRLADIDGDFAKIEKLYIEEIARKNGVTDHELAQVYNDPEAIGSLGALSYEKSVEYLSESLSLVKATLLVLELPKESILIQTYFPPLAAQTFRHVGS